MSDISVIIVNWNTRGLLLDCLASLTRTASELLKEIWVVDNGSSDGSPQAVQAAYPQARLICNPANLGFARACNQALNKVTGRYALLLNTDVILQEEAVQRLRDLLEAHPKAAMAGGQLFHGDGREQNSFAPFPGLLTELTHKGLLRLLFPQRFATRTRRKDRASTQTLSAGKKRLDPNGGLPEARRPPHRPPGGEGPAHQPSDAWPADAPSVTPWKPVESLVGACMLVRRTAFQQVGLLDEDYFFFLEETDWCYRFRQAGWTIAYLPQARITHLQGQTAKAHLAQARIEYCRSRYLFFRKHRGRAASAVLRIGLLVRFSLDALSMALLNLLTLFSRPRYRQKLSVYGQILGWHLRGCPEGGGLRGRAEDGGQRAEGRGQRAEGRGRSAEDAGRRTEGGGKAIDTWPLLIGLGYDPGAGCPGPDTRRPMADSPSLPPIHWQVRPDRLEPLSPFLRGDQNPTHRRPVKANRVREVAAITLHGEAGGPCIYWKSYHQPLRRDRLASFWISSKARREAEIALALREKGIPTVLPLAVGERRNGRRAAESVLLTEEIPGARPLADVYRDELMGNTTPAAIQRKRRLTRRLACLVAQIHRQGVHHADFHAGNVLVREGVHGDELFVVDLHSVRLRRRLTRAQRLASLVQLNIFFQERLNAAGRLRFLRVYAGEDPQFQKKFKQYARLVERRSRRALRRLFERRGRRCLRENNDFLPFAVPGCSGYLRRAHEETDRAGVDLREPHLLWERPEREMVKESGEGGVARLPLSANGRPTGIYIKRSVATGLWDVWKGRVRGPRAFRAWKAAHALLARGFQTPRPLGTARRSVGALSREDYFVTREVPDVLGIDWFVLREFGPQSPLERRRERKRIFVQQLARLVRRLHDLGVYHPDLKASNLLVGIAPQPEDDPCRPGQAKWAAPEDEDRPPQGGRIFTVKYAFFLVDLEGLRVRRRLRRRQRIRNLSQINASLNHTPTISRTDRLRFLKTYLGPQGWQKDHRLAGEAKVLWKRVFCESRKRLERAGRSFT